ncbi:hypothetical protein FXO38_25579 [Capsicum annuum]|nr:hypothetical protein FXO38_25579 [Capsicum annuum]
MSESNGQHDTWTTTSKATNSKKIMIAPTPILISKFKERGEASNQKTSKTKAVEGDADKESKSGDWKCRSSRKTTLPFPSHANELCWKSYVLLFLEVDLMLLPTKTIDFAHIKDYINLIALSSGIVLDSAPWEAKGDASTAHLTDIPDADADTTVALI